MSAAWATFIGLSLVGMLFFRDKIPYLPRKYFKCPILRMDEKAHRWTRHRVLWGWLIKNHGIQFFYLQTGFFKGVIIDRGILRTVQYTDESPEGEIVLKEKVIGVNHPSNFEPANI